MKTLAIAAAAVLATLTMTVAPADAKPHLGKVRDSGGSCARVLIDSEGACDLAGPKHGRQARMRRCYHPGFRDRHPVRCERWLERHADEARR